MGGTPELINAFQRLSVKERNANLFQLLVEAGAKTVVVDGENGEIEGLVADRTVMLKYFKNRIWAWETVGCARRVLAKGGTYIDLGANIGLTTIPVAKLGDVRCIAVEAMPENARLLRMNLARNDVADQVTVHGAAVAAASGPVTLEIAPENKGDHRIRDGAAPDAEPVAGRYGEARRATIEVPGRSLGSLVKLSDIKGPLVIKMDIQGAEPFAVASATPVFKRADLLLTEYWPYGLLRLGSDPQAYLAQLAAIYPFAAELPEGAEPESLSFVPSGEITAKLARFGADGAIEATDIAFSATEQPFGGLS